jgi:cytoskeletal protein CcmA (bactofilin family)
MAQIIKHRRGSIGALKDVTANVGELVIATGSIGDLNAPVVFVGSAATAGGYKAVSKIYRGSTAPTLGSDYGTVMDGTPFYSSNSKTFYILDKDGNITMDLSGNLEGNTISGITINNITGSRATFDTFVSSSALNVTGNTQMGGTLNVNGSTTINNNLTVTGTTSVSGTTNLGSSLNVTGATTLYSATTINAGLTVTGNTNVNSALNVTGATTLYSATTINAGLTVTGTTNANGGLNVTGSVNISGATSVTGALNVSENTTFQKDLYVSGNIYQTGSFYTQGDIVLSGSINIGNSLTGDTINFGGEVNSHIIPTTNNTYDLGTSAKAWKDLYVSGTAHIGQLNLGSIQLTNLDLPGYLNVTGATTLYSATTINAGLTVTGNTTVSGDFLANGSNSTLTANYGGNNIELVTYNGATIDLYGPTTINGDLTVTGTTNLGSVLNVTGATTLYSATTINAGLTVTGTTDLNGPLNVTGATTLYSATTINAGLTVTGTTDLNGPLNVTGATTLYSATTINAGLTVTGTTNINSALNVTGATTLYSATTINANLTVTGTTNVNGPLNVTGATTLYSATTINDNLTVTGTTSVSGTTNLGSALNVTGATTLYSATTINADLTVTGTTTLSGSISVEDLTEKRLVVVGVDGLLTDYTGLTFDNGNLNVSGAIEVTNIQGTGSLYLKPDLDDPRLFEIYNSAAPSGYTDIHFLGNADFNFFGDDTNYLKIDDTAQTVSIVGVNGVFVSSSLKVTGSVNISGNTSVTGAFTVASGSMTSLGGDLYVSGNLQVLGSQTNVQLQSHTVDIGDNIIQVNAYSPFQRYAGLSAYDSGSVGNSGSLLWDSTNDYWLFQNANGTSSKIVGVSGGTFGSEASLTSGTFPIATTGNTIGDSLLIYSGTTLSLNGKFSVDSGTGETKIQGNLNISYSGATMSSGLTSNVLFINSNDDIGFISSADTTSVTDRLLGYNTSTGNLEFSSLIDGGTY